MSKKEKFEEFEFAERFKSILNMINSLGLELSVSDSYDLYEIKKDGEIIYCPSNIDGVTSFLDGIFFEKREELKKNGKVNTSMGFWDGWR
jgi:hypothetical protein